MTKTKAGDIGVFFDDEGIPATLWEYQGANAIGEHVFASGRLSTNDFRLIHRASLADFWPLCNELSVR